MVSIEILTILLLLAAVSVIQFFRGRKLNLELVKFYSAKSVEVFKPEDKIFTWLGGYIGFRAKFDLQDGMKLEYTLTLLPRHSLMYFPVSLITNRHDKLYLVFRLRNLDGEAHLIKRGYYRIKPKIENEIALRKEVVKIGNYDYEILYDKKDYADWIVNFIQGFSKIRNVKHISLTPSTKVLYILMKPEPETIERDFRYIYDYIKSHSGKLRLS
jgi:effector-binding domain-containing protein